MTTTTGTSMETYYKWLDDEVHKKRWGSVGITFTICNGQTVGVEKISVDKDHFQMVKSNRQ